MDICQHQCISQNAGIDKGVIVPEIDRQGGLCCLWIVGEMWIMGMGCQQYIYIYLNINVPLKCLDTRFIGPMSVCGTAGECGVATF